MFTIFSIFIGMFTSIFISAFTNYSQVFSSVFMSTIKSIFTSVFTGVFTSTLYTSTQVSPLSGFRTFPSFPRRQTRGPTGSHSSAPRSTPSPSFWKMLPRVDTDRGAARDREPVAGCIPVAHTSAGSLHHLRRLWFPTGSPLWLSFLLLCMGFPASASTASFLCLISQSSMVMCLGLCVGCEVFVWFGTVWASWVCNWVYLVISEHSCPFSLQRFFWSPFHTSTSGISIMQVLDYLILWHIAPSCNHSFNFHFVHQSG